ncbi:DUF4920 domain-containing protein [Aurantibacter sp.]|uniref:DUF4920 domain-containing protein n=1 Tax=Aurantibacter sp. TaxID=2807103 RepID=UPI0035C82A27
MKYAVVVFLALFLGCKNETYKSFGEKIISDDAIEVSSMLSHYKVLKEGDTLDTKITAKVLDVCQSKGCWMVLDLGEDQTARVKFKDYGFFMPKDIKGKEVVVNGKAFVNVMPVDELRHYAEDAGKTKEEIAAIVDTEKTYSLLADGVLLKQ